MKDLVDFKNAQIEALLRKCNEQEKRISILETWIFELSDEGCPSEYKQIVKNELLKPD